MKRYTNKIASVRGRLADVMRVIRLRPFDTATPEGRSDERYRRVVLTTVTSVINKCTSMLTLLISVPLTIKYLGPERYGMWMTIASLITMLSFSDLGIGNGLLNLISESHGREDKEAAARYVSSAFFMLLGIACLIPIAILALYPIVPWQHWFNVVSPSAVCESGPTVLVLASCFALNMPLAITHRVQNGHQEGYVSNLWTAFGNCLGLAGVLTAIRVRAGLPWLVLALAGAPVFVVLLNGIWQFGFVRPWLRPRIRNVRIQNTRRLFGTGILFFVLQLSLAVGFQSDNIVLARILGAATVTDYAVTSRMFSTTNVLLGFLIMPLWPAYGEAFARGDVAWMRRTLFRSVSLILSMVVPLNLALVFSGKWLLLWWVGPQVTASFTLLVGLGISQTLMAVAVPLSVFLNGVNVVGLQAISAALMALTNISASVYLTHRIGVPGVIYGSVLAQCLFFISPFVLLARRTLSQMSETSKSNVAIITTTAPEQTITLAQS